MKKIVLGIATLAMMASCTTLRQSTVSTVDVNTAVSNQSTADLIVADAKISHIYVPEGKEKKASMNTILNNAVYEALKENGNADVLVNFQYQATVTKKLWFNRKVQKVVITGYPATYKNFKNK